MNVSDEDRALVRSALILPLVVAAFERDMRVILAHVKSPDPYEALITDAIGRAQEELRQVRAAMRKRGVKIYESTRSSGRYLARYLCRGFNGDLALLEAQVTQEAVTHMRRYLNAEKGAPRTE